MGTQRCKFETSFQNASYIESDYDALKYFLQYDPSLYKSKYIRNYLNENEKLNVI